jgi:hypothetical protein
MILREFAGARGVTLPRRARIVRRVVLVAAVCIASAALSAGPARFAGRVVLEVVEDIEFNHKLRLLEDFSFQDEQGTVWHASKGAIIDGTSVPRGLRAIPGLPFEGDYRKASVVHDFQVRAKTRPWREVHRMLYRASLVEGLSEPEAKLVYMAAYAGGGRWELHPSSCYGSCHASASLLAWRPDVTVAELQPVVEWLQQGNPSLEEIEQRVDAVTPRPGPHLFAQLRPKSGD